MEKKSLFFIPEKMTCLNKLKSITVDKWSIIFILIISASIINNLGYWKNGRKVIVSDVVHYYSYLPAHFIYDDVTLQNPNDSFYTNHHDFSYVKQEGRSVFKTTMGMSILYSPFFFIAHSLTTLLDAEASGFSPPYQLAICVSSIFYLALGLIFSRKILLQYFSERTVAVTLITFYFGTNLFFYTILAHGMSHMYLFGLSSCFIHLILKYLKHPKILTSIFIGFILGLMILIRPTMIVFSSLPFLFNVTSIKELKNRFNLIINNKWHFILACIFALSVWIPQFLYWKLTTNHYLFFSYSGEKFYWLDPKLIEFVFGFRKGWLLYSPILILSILGICISLYKKQTTYLLTFFILIFYTYLSSCWWTWWFGGGYGARSMIDIYSLLIIPFAYSLNQLWKNKIIWSKLIFVGSILFCISLNILHTRQYHGGIIHHDSMTKDAYFKIFFQFPGTITRQEVAPFLDPPDYTKALNGIR